MAKKDKANQAPEEMEQAVPAEETVETVETEQTEESLAKALVETYGITEERALTGVKNFLEPLYPTGVILKSCMRSLSESAFSFKLCRFYRHTFC